VTAKNGVAGYFEEPEDVAAAVKYAIEILSRADRGREMGIAVRADAKKKFCLNDAIPRYEATAKTS
jgi:hypothetical protein